MVGFWWGFHAPSPLFHRGRSALACRKCLPPTPPTAVFAPPLRSLTPFTPFTPFNPFTYSAYSLPPPRLSRFTIPRGPSESSSYTHAAAVPAVPVAWDSSVYTSVTTSSSNLNSVWHLCR